ncbi:MAG: hypothetical protein H7Z39_12455 [Burkholderiaceae bacterium]|nr:hypothetical protein [Burkholderiaceae bacterium]
MSLLRRSRSLLMPLCLVASSAWAISLADLSNADAGSGLKAVGVCRT